MAALTLGKRVRDRREELGLSREKLARNSDVSTATISRIELQDHIPTATTLWRVASALGVTVDALLSEAVAS